MKITLKDGRTIYEGERVDPAAFPDLPAGITVSLSADEQRQDIRDRIRHSAGDNLSLLGTTADGAQLVLYQLAVLVKGLAAASSLAEVRAAAVPFAAQAGTFLDRVESGKVRLPFLTKGEEAVMAEIETRATAVTAALTGGGKDDA